MTVGGGCENDSTYDSRGGVYGNKTHKLGEKYLI